MSIAWNSSARTDARRSWWWDNPLWTREVRSRMRGGRAVWILLIYLVVLGAGILLSWSPDAVRMRSGQLGQELFGVLRVIQAALIGLLAPGLACGTFAGEREGSTLDGLLASPLSAAQLVYGKLGSAVGFILFLLTATLPLLAVTWLFGGVSTNDVAGTFALHFSYGILLAALGVSWSIHCRTTAVAATMTYLTGTGLLFAITLLTYGWDAVLPINLLPILPYQPEPYSWSGPEPEHLLLLGRQIPIWFFGLLVPWFGIGWLTDTAICRLNLIRDRRRSIRPRLWLAALVNLFPAAVLIFAVVTGLSTDEACGAVGLLLILLTPLLPTFAIEEDELQPARPGSALNVTRNEPSSASVFAFLLPWPLYVFIGLVLATPTSGLLGIWPEFTIGYLLLALSLLAMTELGGLLGREEKRWGPYVATLLGMLILYIIPPLAAEAIGTYYWRPGVENGVVVQAVRHLSPFTYLFSWEQEDRNGPLVVGMLLAAVVSLMVARWWWERRRVSRAARRSASASGRR